MTTVIDRPTDEHLPEMSAAGACLDLLRTIFQGLKHTPLPDVAHDTIERWRANPPAPRHMTALIRIVENEGLSVSALAEQLGVSLATASQVVTDLERDDLVVRVSDPDDRRRTLVRVSDDTREVVTALVATRLAPMQRALDRMRPADRKSLMQGLAVIAGELETGQS